MNEGWSYLFNSRKEHYFVQGKSLCGKFLILGSGDCSPSAKKPCKGCLKKLERRKSEEK